MPSPGEENSDLIPELRSRAAKGAVADMLSIELVELTPGYAKLTVALTPTHQHVPGIIFGGLIMSLADLAFFYCVNSVRKDSVALDFNMDFIAPPQVGDTLTAEGKCVKSGRRISFADMTVTRQDGKLIARATGKTITTK